MSINKLYSLIVFLIFFSNSNCQSTNLKKVESIEYYYQKCLDQGTDMLGCSDKYYFFCDKLLNEVYQTIKTKLNQKDKKLLKIEQLKWIKKRDLYFKKAYFEAKDEAENLSTEDLQMIFIDKKADYVKERVVFLIKKFKI